MYVVQGIVQYVDDSGVHYLLSSIKQHQRSSSSYEQAIR